MTSRAPYSNTRVTVRTYALLWSVFVVGLSAVGLIQLATGYFAHAGQMLGRYGPSVAGVTLGFLLLSALNAVVNRRRRPTRAGSR